MGKILGMPERAVTDAEAIMALRGGVQQREGAGNVTARVQDLLDDGAKAGVMWEPFSNGVRKELEKRVVQDQIFSDKEVEEEDTASSFKAAFKASDRSGDAGHEKEIAKLRTQLAQAQLNTSGVGNQQLMAYNTTTSGGQQQQQGGYQMVPNPWQGGGYLQQQQGGGGNYPQQQYSAFHAGSGGQQVRSNVCFDYQKGRCTRPHCLFTHENLQGATEAPECQFGMRCRYNGKGCKYTHTRTDKSQRDRPGTPTPSRQVEIVGEKRKLK
jgi:hypothetical protein